MINDQCPYLTPDTSYLTPHRKTEACDCFLLVILLESRDAGFSPKRLAA